MADRDYGWRDRDEYDEEGRHGRERFRGPNREASSRGAPYEGWRAGYRGGYGDYGREFGGRYGAAYGYGYGGETGWDRDLERSRDFDRNRAYEANADYDREYGGYGGHGRYGTSSSRLYGSSWDRGPYGGFGDRQGTAVGRPNFTGRGPKNWKRSDDRITDDVNEQLARDPDLDASDIEVRVSKGVVTLSGVVEDRGDKRRAEDIAETVFGVDDVQNDLKIRHGFLSRLTGEHADEREVTRGAERETAPTKSSGPAASGTRGAGTRATSRR